ncbi:tetratricopeptide repeat protein [Bifidobacterium tibiigranuli]|jgi:tetratricopeptide (TPR) repeat protein|uniref:tetratricopeptide repeat protein n=1 Tax=Bifidobacterium tibiigranuli TaxID=2172043 RepID=UPI00235775C6|nr:tetratricopeptide repeat protein [Bifidobacterium tibiigranuli]MCI1211348.1 tetratricopeptide repeat protein [Bifidobacterium tibiigranuli]MCI1220682.1 tetratricopeptide repeat protein [Bifidobacterium tibiigranuli]
MPEFIHDTNERARSWRGSAIFAKLRSAVHALGVADDGGRRTGADQSAGPSTSSHDGVAGLLDDLRQGALLLPALTKHRMFTQFEGIPSALALGWAQLPQSNGQAFSLGVFMGERHFAQIALADAKGRVFIGTDPAMDTHGMEPCLLFGKEGLSHLPEGARLGNDGMAHGLSLASTLRRLKASTVRNENQRAVDVVRGGIVGRDASGQMTWLASWLKHDNRYTLEQLRMKLPESMRFDLEYRDAIAIAFFAAYLLVQLGGQLIGFGSGNIFRRLNREAPMGAIRRCVRDMNDARSRGLRVSGLEEYFSDLMEQAGALEPTPGLEAVHGAEPLHLYTSSYSGSYFFAWDSSMEFAPALKSLRIEGNLNRFSSVSGWLERNARIGATPIEDTVTRIQAAQIDLALLEDPALGALGFDDQQAADLAGDDGIRAIEHMVDAARESAQTIARESPDPAGGTDASGTDSAGTDAGLGSEWVVRQTLATLLRQLKLPYRFDVEFRSNLSAGNAAFAFTTAGASMMPSQRYDSKTRTWAQTSPEERAAMSADYNLRVGLIMAALGFGANPHIHQISLHIDSIGLEEAVAEQDSAITQMMNQALNAFERMRAPDLRFDSSKADPKDGDVHGDPTRANTTPDDEELRRRGETPANQGDTESGIHPVAGDGANTAAASGDVVNGSAVSGRAESGAANGLADDNAGSAAGIDGVAAGHNYETGHAADHTTGHAAGSETPSESGQQRSGQSQEPQAGDDKAQREQGMQPSIDRQFEDLMQGVAFPDIDEMTFDTMGGDTAHDIAAEGDGGQTGGGDPLEALRRNPSVRTLATVTFTREELLARLHQDGLRHPVETYRRFGAVMDADERGGLRAVNAEFNLRDARFSPLGSQEEPELSDVDFKPGVARVLGASNTIGLSIQREDLLQRAVDDFHRLAAADAQPSVAKAQQAMRIVEELGDPELAELAPQVGSALIDDHDTPDFEFSLSSRLDQERVKTRDMLFSGQAEQALQHLGEQVNQLDEMFAAGDGVPRYFNSYAERVVYNRLFATPGERTVLIPDNLFYAHMELADVLAQLKGAKESLPQLNAMVSYAPTYPLSHMKLAVQLARNEDWDSARAACLNALRVALDRNDAAFAYYRFAYAEWMRDELDVATAAYIMSDHIASGSIGSLAAELHELLARAQSQCVIVPHDVEQAQQLLAAHGLPVWPHTEAAEIVRDAARVCVDNAMFVPARTLSVAAARMNDSDDDGIDMAQAQFLRSLNT